MNRVLLIWFATIAVSASSQGQSFTNLDFESAQIVPSYTNNYGYVFIPTENALPGWSAFDGTTQLSQIQYNPSAAAISPPVALFGSNIDVIAGNFSILLHSSTISISQTALVPSGTESLVFDAVSFGSPSLLVSMGGQNLSYTAISVGTNPYGRSYTVYAADVSAFAGQMETLTFSGGGILDDIQFSPEAIPEPSTASLVFLGSGVLLYVRKRRQTVLQC